MPAHRIFADYCQFYLFDEAVSPAYPEDITEIDLQRQLKAVPNLVSIYTESATEVAVTVECDDLPPRLDHSEWVHIVQGPLDVPSGRIVLASPSSEVAHTPLIAVPPGTYRIQVASGHSETATPISYLVSLWPSTAAAVEVIKSSVQRA